MKIPRSATYVPITTNVDLTVNIEGNKKQNNLLLLPKSFYEQEKKGPKLAHALVNSRWHEDVHVTNHSLLDDS